MKRTSIMLPEHLKQQAMQYAKEHDMTLGQFIRHSMLQQLQVSQDRIDPFFADTACYDGPVPKDLSLNHDDYLYGEKD